MKKTRVGNIHSSFKPIIDLQTLLNGVYERAKYHLAIDYNQELVLPLKVKDVSWVDTLLREQGLRNN